MFFIKNLKYEYFRTEVGGVLERTLSCIATRGRLFNPLKPSG
jgi:hypothetical protein